MALKDLSGKAVFDLERGDFEKLFCRYCREEYRCAKEPKTVTFCKQLVDNGVWDITCRKRHDQK